MKLTSTLRSNGEEAVPEVASGCYSPCTCFKMVSKYAFNSSSLVTSIGSPYFFTILEADGTAGRGENISGEKGVLSLFAP